MSNHQATKQSKHSTSGSGSGPLSLPSDNSTTLSTSEKELRYEGRDDTQQESESGTSTSSPTKNAVGLNDESTQMKLKKGMKLDIRDKEYILSSGTVLAVYNNQFKKQSVLVRYDGWGNEWDEKVSLNEDDPDGPRISRLFSFTRRVKCLIDYRHFVKNEKKKSSDSYDSLKNYLWPCSVNFRMPHPLSEHTTNAEKSLRMEDNIFINPYGYQQGILPRELQSTLVNGGAWVSAKFLLPWVDDKDCLGDVPKYFKNAHRRAVDDTSLSPLLIDNAMEEGTLLLDEFRVKEIGGAPNNALPSHHLEINVCLCSSDKYLDMELKAKRKLQAHLNKKSFSWNNITPPRLPITSLSDSPITKPTNTALPEGIMIDSVMYPGVNLKWLETSQKWQASVMIRGNEIFLGHFTTQTEAKKAAIFASGIDMENVASMTTGTKRSHSELKRAVPLHVENNTEEVEGTIRSRDRKKQKLDTRRSSVTHQTRNLMKPSNKVSPHNKDDDSSRSKSSGRQIQNTGNKPSAPGTCKASVSIRTGTDSLSNNDNCAKKKATSRREPTQESAKKQKSNHRIQENTAKAAITVDTSGTSENAPQVPTNVGATLKTIRDNTRMARSLHDEAKSESHFSTNTSERPAISSVVSTETEMIVGDMKTITLESTLAAIAEFDRNTTVSTGHKSNNFCLHTWATEQIRNHVYHSTIEKSEKKNLFEKLKAARRHQKRLDEENARRGSLILNNTSHPSMSSSALPAQVTDKSHKKKKAKPRKVVLSKNTYET